MEDKEILKDKELEKVSGGVDIPESIKSLGNGKVNLDAPNELKDGCYEHLFEGTMDNPKDPSLLKYTAVS